MGKKLITPLLEVKNKGMNIINPYRFENALDEVSTIQLTYGGGSTDSSVISTEGTLIVAKHPSIPNPGTSYTCNGIAFEPSYLLSPFTRYNNSDNYKPSSGYSSNTMSANFQTMMDTIYYLSLTKDQLTDTLSFTNLTVGSRYLLQVFSSDARFTDRRQKFTIGTVSSTLSYQHVCTVVTFKFKATSTTMVLKISTPDSSDIAGVINAYQLRLL